MKRIQLSNFPLNNMKLYQYIKEISAFWNIIDSNQGMKLILMSINRYRSKCDKYRRISFDLKKEGHSVICDSVNEAGEYYTKEKSGTERQKLHGLFYIWNLKKKSTQGKYKSSYTFLSQAHRKWAAKLKLLHRRNNTQKLSAWPEHKLSPRNCPLRPKGDPDQIPAFLRTPKTLQNAPIQSSGDFSGD